MKVFHKDTFDAEVLKSSKPVLVDFFATWCGPCKMQAPILDELAQELGDSVTIGKVDIDQDTELSIQYGVMSVPTLMVFRGGKPVSTMVGVQDKETLKKALA